MGTLITGSTVSGLFLSIIESLMPVEAFIYTEVGIKFMLIAIIMNDKGNTAVILTKSLSAACPPNAVFNAFPAIAEPIPPLLLDCIKMIPTSIKHTRTNNISII